MWFAVGLKHMQHLHTLEECRSVEQLDRWLRRGELQAKGRTRLVPLRDAMGRLRHSLVHVLDRTNFSRDREVELRGHMGTHPGFLQGYIERQPCAFPELVTQANIVYTITMFAFNSLYVQHIIFLLHVI